MENLLPKREYEVINFATECQPNTAAVPKWFIVVNIYKFSIVKIPFFNINIKINERFCHYSSEHYFE